MDAKALRKRQSPLKNKYRKDPQKAEKTLTAEGVIGEEVTCNVKTHNGITTAGLHPATGGDESVACSGDMLLQSLAACAGVTLNAVATNMGYDIKDGTVKAEGDLDFRGTLGVSKDAPVGFTKIRLHFDLKSGESESRIEKLIDLTERFCVIYQTLQEGVTIKVSHSKQNAK